MAGKLLWRDIIESHVRPSLIVVAPPSFDDRFGVFHGFEPMHVQALVAQRSIEGLHVTVIGRFAGPTEIDAGFAVVGP